MCNTSPSAPSINATATPLAQPRCARSTASSARERRLHREPAAREQRILCLLVLVAGAADGVGLAEAGRRALRVALDEEGHEEDDGDEEAEDHREEGAERHLKANGAAIDGHHASERLRSHL